MIINKIRSGACAVSEVFAELLHRIFAGFLRRRCDGANFGDIRTVRLMEKKGQAGRKSYVDKKNYANRNKQIPEFLHLGFYEEEKIVMMETLSVLVIGDSGTGKTAGFMVPSIVDSIKCSMLINDPKTELWDVTSGHRACFGPTYKLDWLSNDKNFANFNFLDSRIASSLEVWRNSLIDLIVEALIPEESRCNYEHYAFVRGQQALRGFLHMIVAKITDREDPERYAGISRSFEGKQASLPMLADWLANKLEEDRMAQAGGNGANRMIDTINGVLKEAEEHEYPFRVKSELGFLTGCSDEVRTGILATVENSLRIFTDPAVAQRCSSSDFTPEDIRGRLTEQALDRMGLTHYPETRDEWNIVQKEMQSDDWKPVSVYLCTDLAANPHAANLTKLFFQICSGAMLGWKPNEFPTSSIKLGPFPVCFALDEFHQLPRMYEVLDAPAISRSQDTFYLFSVQNYNQIKKVYSAEDAGIIDGTTGVRVIFRQSNWSSINRIVRTVGKTEGEENVLSKKNLACMPAGEHLILVQGYINNPIWVKTPMYFQFPEFQKKTFNPRTQEGPPAAPPRPAGNRA